MATAIAAGTPAGSAAGNYAGRFCQSRNPGQSTGAHGQFRPAHNARYCPAIAAAPPLQWAGHNAALQQLQDSIRSEEHTSELQSRENLVCRLLLEKKKIHKPMNSATNDIGPDR